MTALTIDHVELQNRSHNSTSLQRTRVLLRGTPTDLLLAVHSSPCDQKPATSPLSSSPTAPQLGQDQATGLHSDQWIPPLAPRQGWRMPGVCRRGKHSQCSLAGLPDIARSDKPIAHQSNMTIESPRISTRTMEHLRASGNHALP